ncbi:MAG: hypothetical protein U0802_06005 [Candidatus Binatia bacterium]
MRDEAELAERRAASARQRELAAVVAEREALVAERADWDGAQAELSRGGVAAWGIARGGVRRGPRRRRASASWKRRRRSAAAPRPATRWSRPTTSPCWSRVGGAHPPSWRSRARLAPARRGRRLRRRPRKELERTRQPAVLREASRTFAAVTGHRYERIAQDEQGAALVVVERDGLVKQAGGELGRGTAEALYLAVRLGLASELARRGTALPLVFDDVLVNLDPERAAAMAAALGDVAQRRQVLFFTCHPSTRDLLVREGHGPRGGALNGRPRSAGPPSADRRRHAAGNRQAARQSGAGAGDGRSGARRRRGEADVAAARAFAALLNAAKARLNEHGQRWHTHARVAAAYAVLPPAAAAPATWLGDALALRARLAADPDGLDYAAVEVLVDRARRFVDATRAVCP